MNHQEQSTAAFVVMQPGWKWRKGLLIDGYCGDEDTVKFHRLREDTESPRNINLYASLPVLSDKRTMAILKTLAQEYVGDQTAEAVWFPEDGRWVVLGIQEYGVSRFSAAKAYGEALNWPGARK
jgi:hypothetical protein